jgi:hypothetical protein
MSQWWVTQAGETPKGPFEEDELVRKLASGELPSQTLVCIVGGDRWQEVNEVPAFAAAVQGARLRRFDESDEKTIVDDMPLALQEDGEERSTMESNPPTMPKRRA